MSDSLKDLLIAVKADVDSAIKDFGRVTRELNNVGKQAESLGRNLQSIGSNLTKALTLPLLGAAGVGLKFYTDFEASMNKVSALGDITGQSLKDLSEQAKQLGATTQFSAKQAAEGMKELAAAGFTAAQITKSIPGVLSLAAAGEMELARAAEVSVNILGAYQLSASDAAHVSDVLAKAAASGSLSVEDLGFSFKYVGPVAKSAGVALETTASALALLSNAGIKGEAAGTAMRGILASLIDPSKDGTRVLQALGVSVKDTSGKLLPFGQILDSLKEKNISQAQVFQLVGREAASAFQILLDQGSKSLNTLASDFVNSDGAAKQMASTMTSGLTGALSNASSAAEGLAVSLGEVLAPYATQLLNNFTALTGALQGMISQFNALPQGVKDAAVVVSALVAAIGPLLIAFGAIGSAGSIITSGLSSIVSAMKLLSASLGFVGTTIGGVSVAFLGWVAAIGAAVAALAALGVWVYQHWTQITGVMIQAWQGVSEFIIHAVNNWYDPISLTARFVVMTWKGIYTVSVAIFGGISSFVTTVFEGIKSIAVATLNAIGKAASYVGETLLAWKVPGAEKLLTLDQTWKRLGQTINTTAKVAEKAADVVSLPGLVTPDSSLTADTGTSSKKSKIKQFKMPKAHKLAAPKDPFDLWLSSAKDPVDALEAALSKLTDTTDSKVIPSLLGMADPLKLVSDEAIAYSDAIQRMGVVTTQSLQDSADAASRDFETIKNGSSSVNEIRQAYIKWAEAMVKLKAARGEDVTDLVAGLKKAQAEIDSASGKSLERLKKPLQEVSTVLTSMSQSIASAIVSWRGFGSVVVGVVQSIGKALIADILQNLVFTESRMKVVSDGLGSLLSKIPGLSGVFGKSVGTIAKTATDASSTVASTASKTIGSVAKVGSTALSSALGVVTGAVSAVTGVIGLFQGASQGQDIARIEVTSRGQLNQLISIQNTLNQYLPSLSILTSQLSQIYNTGLGVYSPTQTEVRARILGNTIASGGGTAAVMQVDTLNLYGGPSGLDQLADELLKRLRARGASI